ncbi:MAG: ABC transporter permease [Nocardioidaceae bacterium]|nr:ABC transporter permease [Nocardioidaceae bacterium]
MSTLLSVPRTVRLARWNAVLLRRNTLALTFATAMPLLPLLLLLTGDRGEPGVGIAAVISTMTMALLFPVFYNVLSQFVTRRDELVLKRLRTGEARDVELLVALALPGGIITALLGLAVIPLAMAAGQMAPRNVVLYLLSIVLTIVMYAAFAFWTAAWTRNAEAAQLTSAPVIMLALVGQLSVSFPDAVQRWTDLTPGAALTNIVRVCWFGFESRADTSTLSFADTWAQAVSPILVLIAWTALAIALAQRSLRWEPRS